MSLATVIYLWIYRYSIALGVWPNRQRKAHGFANARSFSKATSTWRVQHPSIVKYTFRRHISIVRGQQLPRIVQEGVNSTSTIFLKRSEKSCFTRWNLSRTYSPWWESAVVFARYLHGRLLSGESPNNQQRVGAEEYTHGAPCILPLLFITVHIAKRQPTNGMMVMKMTMLNVKGRSCVESPWSSKNTPFLQPLQINYDMHKYLLQYAVLAVLIVVFHIWIVHTVSAWGDHFPSIVIVLPCATTAAAAANTCVETVVYIRCIPGTWYITTRLLLCRSPIAKTKTLRCDNSKQRNVVEQDHDQRRVQVRHGLPCFWGLAAGKNLHVDYTGGPHIRDINLIHTQESR